MYGMAGVIVNTLDEIRANGEHIDNIELSEYLARTYLSFMEELDFTNIVQEAYGKDKEKLIAFKSRRFSPLWSIYMLSVTRMKVETSFREFYTKHGKKHSLYSLCLAKLTGGCRRSHWSTDAKLLPTHVLKDLVTYTVH